MVKGWFQGLAGAIRRKKNGRREESIFSYFLQTHLSKDPFFFFFHQHFHGGDLEKLILKTLDVSLLIRWSVLETVKDYTHLLISIPPLADIGDPVIATISCIYPLLNMIFMFDIEKKKKISFQKMLRNVQLVREKLSSGKLRWLCYLSSTSILSFPFLVTSLLFAFAVRLENLHSLFFLQVCMEILVVRGSMNSKILLFQVAVFCVS